ncbi:MAG: glycosyltransferase family 4 protein [Gemmatimonadales bacterium]|jgi:glycosyltransferase involved in cell wall biosynthesis
MSERLHILVLCYEYPPVGGGGGVGASQYAEAWAAAGHRVTVLTSGTTALPIEEESGGLRVVRLRVSGRKERATATNRAMLGYLVAGAGWIAGHRDEFRDLDVINTHFAIPTGPLGAFASHVLDAPNVLTIIGGDIYDPSKSSSPHRHLWSRIANRWLVGHADEVIAISSDTRDRARRYYGIERPIQVIPYGFSPPEDGEPSTDGEPLSTTADDFRLMAVGRLVPRKGFDHLLRALAELPPNVRLEVVGDGPLAEPLRRQATELGISDRVSWPGFLPRPEILRRLRRSDCFVLSSLHEGLGIVVQEAMHAGLPVVATDNGGQVDLVSHETTGLLVPVADPAALAAAVRRLMDDPDSREAMGRRGRERIAELAMPQNARQVAGVLRAAIGAAAG